MDRLLGEGVCAGDDGLRGDDGGHGRERHHRIMGPPRREQEERVLGGVGVRQKQSSLAEIVEHESRQHHGEPSELDGHSAEMAHIRIHRLGAGECEEGGAEHGEGDARSAMN